MFKNIGNFLKNQFGGFQLLAPPKDVKTLSVDEIKSYIDAVIVNVAEQIVDSLSKGENVSGQSKQVFSELLVNLTENTNFLDAELSVLGRTPQEFVKFCLDHCEKWIVHFREKKSVAKPVAREQFVISGPAGNWLGRMPLQLVAPFEKSVSIQVREVVDRAPVNVVARQMQPRVSVRNAVESGLIQKRSSQFQ